MPLPIPDAAPVTRATLPLSRSVIAGRYGVPRAGAAAREAPATSRTRAEGQDGPERAMSTVRRHGWRRLAVTAGCGGEGSASDEPHASGGPGRPGASHERVRRACGGLWLRRRL